MPAFADFSPEAREDTVREHFINFLQPSLKKQVLIANPKTFEEAQIIAQRIETVDSETKTDDKQDLVSFINDNISDKMSQLGMGNGPQARGFQGRGQPYRGRGWNRFNGRGRGYQGPPASYRPRCSICRRDNHTDRDCYQNQASGRGYGANRRQSGGPRGYYGGRGPRSSGTGRGAPRQESGCTYCNGPDHMRQSCEILQRHEQERQELQSRNTGNQAGPPNAAVGGTDDPGVGATWTRISTISPVSPKPTVASVVVKVNPENPTGNGTGNTEPQDQELKFDDTEDEFTELPGASGKRENKGENDTDMNLRSLFDLEPSGRYAEERHDFEVDMKDALDPLFSATSRWVPPPAPSPPRVQRRGPKPPPSLFGPGRATGARRPLFGPAVRPYAPKHLFRPKPKRPQAWRLRNALKKLAVKKASRPPTSSKPVAKKTDATKDVRIVVQSSNPSPGTQERAMKPETAIITDLPIQPTGKSGVIPAIDQREDQPPEPQDEGPSTSGN